MGMNKQNNLAMGSTENEKTDNQKKKNGNPNSNGGGNMIMQKSKNKIKETQDTSIVDSPYVDVVNKKLRSFKKKMDKIKSLEQAVVEGKTLNEQQLEVLGNKSSIEKLLVEVENLKSQIIDIEISKVKQCGEDVAETKETEKETLVESREEKNSQVDAEVMTESDSSMEDEESPEPFAHVKNLLRLLHVVTLQKAVGKTVPSQLDFFVKVLLGTTRPPAELSFEENLNESLEEAKKFLTCSGNEVALETSYKQLHELVDKLLSEDKKVDNSPPTPTFNFFTDSKIEPETLELDKTKIEELSHATNEKKSNVDGSKKKGVAGESGERNKESRNRRSNRSRFHYHPKSARTSSQLNNSSS